MSGPGADAPQDLAAAYALGALSADEARRFEAFLATSPDAQREVAEFKEVAALLALAGTEEAPADTLRDRVLARGGGEKTRALPSRPVVSAGAASRGGWLALAASLLLAAGLGAALVSARGRLAGMQTELAARSRTLAETERRLTERQATLDAILEPGVQLFQLTASGDPDPGIQLFWNLQLHRALVHGYRLKAVPAGRAYQLWFIRDGKPVPSVTFKPDAEGQARVERIPVPENGTVSAAAVTVEPESGSAQPTSPILMVGTLQKS
ncbi:MAG: anti-sigma factor [Gemmatimonadales bacterium]|nr:anti-sigma factor [Gemmatimonadales bacterium]